jgi:ADP-heptose:LPS heptosyltransferase
MFAFPDLAYDISQPWIEVPEREFVPDLCGKILINFTNRYRNQFIHYYFLKKYQKQLLFIGNQKERDEFCTKWDLDINLLVIDNFLQLAQIMKLSKFLLGNQSFCWNLNRALGLPSILEMYPNAPNCTPFVGKDNYGFYHQKALEYYFDKLVKQ